MIKQYLVRATVDIADCYNSFDTYLQAMDHVNKISNDPNFKEAAIYGMLKQRPTPKVEST